MQKIIKILNRPFPLFETNREKFILSVSLGIFIFLFLSVFQPFNLHSIPEHKFLYFAAYGIIASLVLFFNVFVLMKIFNNFYNPENWLVWKHLVNILVIIVSISLSNYFFSFASSIPLDDYYSLPTFIIRTTAVGFFPSIVIVIYLENKLRKKNVKISGEINKQFPLNRKETENNFSVLQFGKQKIDLNKLLYAKSLGNYVSFFISDDNKITRETIRTTMKEVENSLSGNKNIVRCHKSYFVNLEKVTKAVGNARSLFFRIEGDNEQIPVSRKVAKELSSKIS